MGGMGIRVHGARRGVTTRLNWPLARPHSAGVQSPVSTEPQQSEAVNGSIDQTCTNKLPHPKEGGHKITLKSCIFIMLIWDYAPINNRHASSTSFDILISVVKKKKFIQSLGLY